MSHPTDQTLPAATSASAQWRRRRMRLRALAPDLRVPWGALERSDQEIRDPSCVLAFCERSAAAAACDVPAMLRSPATRVLIFGARGEPLEAALRGVAARIALRAAQGGPDAGLGLALALAEWDSAFRAQGLYNGNVYLASEDAGYALAAAAGLHRSYATARAVAAALDTLTALELVYRFPVALKFRGSFGRARQFRLNGWGRRLAARLAVEPTLASMTMEIRERIAEHVSFNRAQYATHMDSLRRLRELPDGEAWASARSLPIGVLI